MPDSKDIHEEMLRWVSLEFKGILEDSQQAIYVYLCDIHKLCNKKFSSMLGYSSPEEWAMKDEMLTDVTDSDQKVLVSAYKNALENKIASNIEISWKGSDGSPIKTQVILVPLSYKGELFAIHFIKRL